MRRIVVDHPRGAFTREDVGTPLGMDRCHQNFFWWVTLHQSRNTQYAQKPGPFEREHHLVNRRWADAKVFLHIGFRRGSAVQTRIEVDKGQVLPLFGREGL
jgi:hypothetical protein